MNKIKSTKSYTDILWTFQFIVKIIFISVSAIETIAALCLIKYIKWYVLIVLLLIALILFFKLLILYLSELSIVLIENLTTSEQSIEEIKDAIKQNNSDVKRKVDYQINTSESNSQHNDINKKENNYGSIRSNVKKTVFCKKCWAEVSDSQTYCPNCKNKL